MRRLRFLIAALLLFSLPASAFDEPTGFRDIAFGCREWEGAKFQNEPLKWSGAKTWMAIIRYADRVDQGSALIITQEFQKILRQREAERRDKARKGL